MIGAFHLSKLRLSEFATVISPALLILKAGSKGALAFLIEAVKEPYHYFWVTGTLSSFLDNAPTYLTFFNTALGAFFAGMPEAEAVPALIATQNDYLRMGEHFSIAATFSARLACRPLDLR